MPLISFHQTTGQISTSPLLPRVLILPATSKQSSMLRSGGAFVSACCADRGETATTNVAVSPFSKEVINRLNEFRYIANERPHIAENKPGGRGSIHQAHVADSPKVEVSLTRA